MKVFKNEVKQVKRVMLPSQRFSFHNKPIIFAIQFYCQEIFIVIRPFDRRAGIPMPSNGCYYKI